MLSYAMLCCAVLCYAMQRCDTARGHVTSLLQGARPDGAPPPALLPRAGVRCEVLKRMAAAKTRPLLLRVGLDLGGGPEGAA